jgi:DNA-directed RNA polymerase specialized sigma24 family protein
VLWRLYKARFEATLSQSATRPSGGYEMMCHRKTGREQANPYATVEDFCRLFAKGMSELYQLSFLLTADHQKAEQCFVAGLEDSMRSNGVFKEWARSWAMRTIVQNAVGQLKPQRSTASSSTFTVAPYVRQLPTGEDRHFGLKAVLALPDFERFAFVMSVLEHYSAHDSALLLGCSPREIREARARAVEQMANSKGTVPIEVNSEKVQELVR